MSYRQDFITSKVIFDLEDEQDDSMSESPVKANFIILDADDTYIIDGDAA